MAARRTRNPSGSEAPGPSTPELAEGPSFEQGLARLEALVDQLEDGELELEAALVAFEEGVSLSRRCAAQLDAAERRIQILVQQDGEWVERPLDEEEIEAEPPESSE